MRILHLIHTPRHSGAEALVRELCVAHAKVGITSAVASLCPMDPAFAPDSEKILQSGGSVFYPHRAPGKIGRVRHYSETITSFNPDIVFAHSVIPALYGKIALPFGIRRPKFVSVLHDGSNDDFRDYYLRQIERVTHWRCDHVVAVSEQGKSSYIKRLANALPVTVIVNGINIERFTQNDHLAARQTLSINPETKIFLQVGRISAVKQQSFSFDSLEPLLRSENVEFWLAGLAEDPSYLDNLKAKVVEQGLQDKVRFLGSRSDVPLLLAAADAFLIPSTHEAHSVALLEALASGVPCLVSNIEVFDFARQLPSVCSVDIGDTAGFLTAARQLLQMPRQNRDLERFSIIETANNYANLASSLLGRL